MPWISCTANGHSQGFQNLAPAVEFCRPGKSISFMRILSKQNQKAEYKSIQLSRHKTGWLADLVSSGARPHSLHSIPAGDCPTISTEQRFFADVRWLESWLPLPLPTLCKKHTPFCQLTLQHECHPTRQSILQHRPRCCKTPPRTRLSARSALFKSHISQL